MFKKIFLISFLLFICSTVLFAQLENFDYYDQKK